ncbi:hypothetical protein AGDE_12432 [Angomonas deanei]|uniref:RNA-editing substrate-binding complex 6 protein domain-containing protein n=1 Tax=Angomonas deanei TaxID=59799 RepID=A0A7G2C4Q1_9TRYP|nr:hypothetical protein AGDE_12432 [Angomonas deanei]CAD2214124.1 hypothetical protein, conserved [Angomonas deanei]|eukprot:EPY24269.1 hypothetical protein AGDE_12432 [Angomonas deanei]
MKDSRVYLPHIANVAHALARVGYSDPALLLVLRDQAVKQSESASPLIAVTLLDAFASLGYMDEQVFQIYEKRIVSCMNEIQGPLLASFFSCLVLANRADKAVVDSIGERVVAIIDTLDSSSIAKFCKAYADSGIVSEEVLGSLAEHSCKVASNFRADEIHQVLHCLSSFDLFDGELFPLLAGRLAILFKQSGQGEIVRPTDAAGILASFAAVQENSDELAYVCTNICALQNILPADAYINVLWACATLNIRNEAQTKLLNRVREQPTLLDFPAEDSGKSKRSARLNSILTDRKIKC